MFLGVQKSITILCLIENNCCVMPCLWYNGYIIRNQLLEKKKMRYYEIIADLVVANNVIEKNITTENELVEMIRIELEKAGESKKGIRYLLNFESDFVRDVIQDIRDGEGI